MSVCDILIEEALAAVTFIWDHYQLTVGTAVITLNVHPRVTINQRSWTSDTEGFRDALCSLIGSKIENVRESELELSFYLSSTAVVAISLHPEDRIGGGPESLVLYYDGGPYVVY